MSKKTKPYHPCQTTGHEFPSNTHFNSSTHSHSRKETKIGWHGFTHFSKCPFLLRAQSRVCCEMISNFFFNILSFDDKHPPLDSASSSVNFNKEKKPQQTLHSVSHPVSVRYRLSCSCVRTEHLLSASVSFSMYMCLVCLSSVNFGFSRGHCAYEWARLECVCVCKWAP